MKKIFLGVVLGLLAVASHAINPPTKQISESAQVLKSSNAFMKQQIQKKRLDEEEWNKQAVGFIGLKRQSTPGQLPIVKRVKSIDYGGMLTTQNLQKSLGDI